MFFSSKSINDMGEAMILTAEGEHAIGRAFYARVERLAVKVSGWFGREALFQDPSALPPRR